MQFAYSVQNKKTYLESKHRIRIFNLVDEGRLNINCVLCFYFYLVENLNSYQVKKKKAGCY